jgi:hypothetical protein
MQRNSVLNGVVLVLTILAAACSGPAPVVDRVTLVNETSFDVEVDLKSTDGEDRLPLAIVDALEEKDVFQVIDQGETWIFRFYHWGGLVDELSISRSELERNDWRVTVPTEVEDRLRDLGRPPAE